MMDKGGGFMPWSSSIAATWRAVGRAVIVAPTSNSRMIVCTAFAISPRTACLPAKTDARPLVKISSAAIVDVSRNGGSAQPRGVLGGGAAGSGGGARWRLSTCPVSASIRWLA